ncbi:MAG: hypothetical protein RMY64_08025 [Nostoc sp. DedQUE08]|uniref:hypothetical protein n=1 Tax=unclassified Nostoc TaxID=2593658 RepID=UPI002AD41F59|nr:MULTISPECIES: hypothetical protein [unclassified Nostoc]MDZ8065575.1 hypothetical protein [Nostoc sp. DedQUE08]MDZ8130453.1 hypothetical protein [Nostoc sp. DedQUE07]
MKTIIFCTTIQVGISAIIGLLWAIIYLLYSQNIQVTLKLFFYSFLGGLFGGIVGGFIGHLVGSRTYKEAPGGIFIGDQALNWFFWFFVFWIIGIIVGAVLGGLIFIRFYS